MFVWTGTGSDLDWWFSADAMLDLVPPVWRVQVGGALLKPRPLTSDQCCKLWQLFQQHGAEKNKDLTTELRCFLEKLRLWWFSGHKVAILWNSVFQQKPGFMSKVYDKFKSEIKVSLSLKTNISFFFYKKIKFWCNSTKISILQPSCDFLSKKSNFYFQQ